MRSKRDIIIVDEFPAYWLYERCILGNFAYTTPKERLILREYTVCHNGEIETPGYHFNQICKTVKFPKKTVYHDEISYPYFAKPGKLPFAFYLDIRQAYYQIADIYGLECVHRQGRYMAFGVTRPPEIMQENKLVRALLVSGTYRTSHMTEWKNHELHARSFPNSNYAPFLQRAIIATLHAIASLLSPLSVYCHTDGYIVPYWNLERVERLLSERGIRYAIKYSGPAEISNVGQYRIGDKATRFRIARNSTADGINHGLRDWWLRQFDRGQSLIQRSPEKGQENRP